MDKQLKTNSETKNIICVGESLDKETCEQTSHISETEYRLSHVKC